MSRHIFGAAAAIWIATLAHAGQAEPAKAGPTGTVAGTVTLKKKGAAKASHAGVVIHLDGVPGALPSTPLPKREIRQRDLSFVPDVLVIVKGTVVDFPNDDKVFHNVFSLSEPAKFDLGLYKSGDMKSVTFKRVGVADVYCNIHPQMVAKVKVLDTVFHAVTKSDGKFVIGNVPVGTYPVIAWQPYGAEFKGSVTVTAGATANLKIELEEGEKPASHAKKDGTPYGQYK